MKKIIIVLIILVGNFVNLYYMGQNVEKESEQDLSIADFENENSIIEEKQEVLNIVDTNEAKKIENNSIIEDEVNNSKQENSEVATYSVTNTIKKEANNQKNIVQENNNQVVEKVNTDIVKQDEIKNDNIGSAINKDISQEKLVVEDNKTPVEEYRVNEKKIAEIRNMINSNPSEDMKLYGYEIVVDSSITEVTTQFTFTEKRVKDKIAWKFGTIRIYAQDYYKNGQYITTECYLI